MKLLNSCCFFSPRRAAGRPPLFNTLHTPPPAEVLGMKLLRTRDNPEYKYTLAFLGEAAALHCTALHTTHCILPLWKGVGDGVGGRCVPGCVPQKGQLLPVGHRCASPTWLGCQRHLITKFNYSCRLRPRGVVHRV